MTNSLLDQLESRAKEATPGPWKKGQNPNVGAEYEADAHDILHLHHNHWYSLTEDLQSKDANYIALANPENILKLCQALRAVRDALDWANAKLNHGGDTYPIVSKALAALDEVMK